MFHEMRWQNNNKRALRFSAEKRAALCSFYIRRIYLYMFSVIIGISLQPGMLILYPEVP